jgi:hypothetical protein
VSGNSIERLLDKIDEDISDYLIFAGVLDNNAKLLSYRKGRASFSLPIERHDTLDVQLSLMFSLIRQLEDISGIHKFTLTRFAKHDTFLFGTPDLHVFVITSPNSEGQVAKTLAELVATMTGSEPQEQSIAAPIASTQTASTTGSRPKDQTMAAAMTTTTTTAVHREEPPVDRQKFQPALKSKPETIAILQGYLMALDADCTIQDDSGGHFKIKSTESDTLTWSTLEKIGSTFKDKIEIHNVGLDTDGKVFVRISLK